MTHDFLYDDGLLKVTDKTTKDGKNMVRAASLPEVVPECGVRLNGEGGVPDIINKAWLIALADIDSNIVDDGKARYFGAGEKFGTIVFTRDIAYSGLMGLNRLYPEIMRDSLKFSRDKRLEVGFAVSEDYDLPDLPIAWDVMPITHKDFKQVHGTNSFLRRTDDVIWLWAMGDLYEYLDEIEEADWRWLYAMGVTFFERFYQPFFDVGVGLYRGQASFVDIHFSTHKATGYPQDWSPADCVMVQATSTNALYVKGMDVIATAAENSGQMHEAAAWRERAEALRAGMRKELRLDDGSFAYFCHVDGALEPRREALGAALAVLAEVVTGEDAERAVAGYPTAYAVDGKKLVPGVPLFYPFFARDDFYHNHAAWPFVETLFLWAKEKATGESTVGQNAALLLRMLAADGTFRELVDMRTGDVTGSPRQLWSAAGLVNLAVRAEWIQ